jgi:hypothetical protein
MFLGSIENLHGAAVPLTTLFGGLIYADIGLLIPIGSIFLEKGINIGLVFTFMMAASGVGLPSIILLTRVFKIRLLSLYLLTIFAMITLTGYLISYLF